MFGAQPRHRMLWASTGAFFLTFVVWFNMAPFAVAIKQQMHLTPAQMGALTLANLALAVPGRLVVGMLLDRFGPRKLFGTILVLGAIPNTFFAMAHSFNALLISRLFVGLVGSGFVVGIRLVSEWFDHDDLGTAEGVYGGWGNFGSAAAAMTLPALATFVAGGAGAWRWGVGATGVMSALYGIFFLAVVRDSPDGTPYQRVKKAGALEVSTRGQAVGLILLQLPVVAALGLVVARIERAHVIDRTGVAIAAGALAMLFVLQVARIWQVNRHLFAGEPAGPDAIRKLTPVALLAIAYGVTFGTELAVISLLPTFFATTFGLKIAAAGVAGSAFAFTNLVTRPTGGLLSDLTGKRVAEIVAMLGGTAMTFVAMSGISKSMPLWLGISIVVIASFFVQAGNGAVFAMVPTVSRKAGGQVAGLAGSYGNVGGIVFSSILFFTATTKTVAGKPVTSAGSTTALFLTVAVTALVIGAACLLRLRATDASDATPSTVGIDLEPVPAHSVAHHADLAPVPVSVAELA